MFVALCESGFHRDLGFEISSGQPIRKDAWLFGEAQGRVVVSVAKDAVAAFEKELDIPYEKLGWITDEKIVIDGEDWGSIIDWKHLYQSSIETILSGSLESEGALSMI